MKILRIIKKGFTKTGIDNIIALLYYKTKLKLLFRLIPDRTFYSSSHEKNIRRNGINFKVSPSDLMQWSIFSESNDMHLEAALNCIKGETKSIILDVGANCGQFSLRMAQKIKEMGWEKNIVAFEPNPNIFNRFNTNLNLNPELKKYITIINKAVGEKASKLFLDQPLRNSGAASFIRNYDHEASEKYEVDVITLDSLYAMEPSLIEFIKLDVEDYEFFVLSGALQIIQKHKPSIYIEVQKSQIMHEKIFEIFNANNYLLFKELERKFVKCHWREIINTEKIQNLLAIHNNFEN